MNDLLLSSAQLDELKQSSWASSRYLHILEEIKKLKTPSAEIQLRELRHKAWLDAAASTYYNLKTTKEIVQEWSSQVDRVLQKAFEFSGLIDEDILLVAMGKLGAEELNLSSDVDLILISDKSPCEKLIKKAHHFTQLLAKDGPHSFCFRVDYDLRPGGRLGPLISSLSQLEEYYWSQGQTWERIAWIRHRVVCGPKIMAEKLETFKSKYCYRKFIDLNLFDELKKLRSQIRKYYYKKYDQEDREFDLKLGTGGIRDIELYLHANLLIHGGKLPQLQKRKTDEIGIELKKNNLAPLKDQPLDTFDRLIEHYWHFRHWEHLVQLVGDEQTHILKINHQHLPSYSPSQWEDIKRRSKYVDKTVQAILGAVQPLSDGLPLALVHQKTYLLENGFSQKSVDQIWPEVTKTSSLSKTKKRDEDSRHTFLGLFIDNLIKMDFQKDRALEILLGFVRAIRAKSSFYALFNHHPQIITELANMFSLSPMLSQILIGRPEVLDGFIYRSVAEFSHDANLAFDQFSYRKQLTDLVASKEFMNSWDIARLSTSLSQCADAITDHLMDMLKVELGASSLFILKMGKWAGRELGLQSDLDFVMVVDENPNEVDHRIAKRFNTQLTGPFKGGRLFDVDMRLRPSGNAGPLLVSKNRLLEYLFQSAKPWERQSYLRAALGDNTYSSDFVAEIKKMCIHTPLSDSDWTELKRILQKLTHPLNIDKLNLKYSPGGLIHIEFASQYYFLQKQIVPLSANTCEMYRQIGQLENNFQVDRLIEVYQKIRAFEQWAQLLSQNKGSVISSSGEIINSLSKIMKTETHLIMKQIQELLRESESLLLPIHPLV